MVQDESRHVFPSQSCPVIEEYTNIGKLFQRRECNSQGAWNTNQGPHEGPSALALSQLIYYLGRPSTKVVGPLPFRPHINDPESWINEYQLRECYLTPFRQTFSL